MERNADRLRGGDMTTATLAFQTDGGSEQYYVSARYGDRTVLLSGPFPTHSYALDQIEATRAFALKVDPRMAFATTGITRWESDAPALPGRLNRLLGRQEVY